MSLPTQSDEVLADTPGLANEKKNKGVKTVECIMGKASRDKGNRFERACVHALQDVGIGAERIPLSGAAGGSFCGDLTVPVQGRDRRIECKKRARAWSDLYQWIVGNYALFIAKDRAETLVVMRLADFAVLAKLSPSETSDLMARAA